MSTRYTRCPYAHRNPVTSQSRGVPRIRRLRDAKQRSENDDDVERRGNINPRGRREAVRKTKRASGRSALLHEDTGNPVTNSPVAAAILPRSSDLLKNELLESSSNHQRINPSNVLPFLASAVIRSYIFSAVLLFQSKVITQLNLSSEFFRRRFLDMLRDFLGN